MRRRQRHEFATEAEFCAKALLHLQKLGSVYPEILGVDYVLHDLDRVCAIEAKLEPNIKVINQAWDRKQTGFFDRQYILVPRWACGHAVEKFYVEICKGLGIGILVFYVQSETLVELLPSPTSLRESDRILELLKPEALNHTVAGRPSCSQWNEWDVLELKYVEWLHGAAKGHGYLQHARDKSFSLDAAIGEVEPRFKGKRGGVLQRGRDLVMSLILTKRWTKFRASQGRIWLESWNTMTTSEWDVYLAD